MPIGKRFTEQEDEFIRANYSSMSYRDIGEHLGRSTISINKRAKKLGLTKFVLRRWSSQEDEIIRNGATRRLADVAKELGRRQSEVSSRARELGLESWRKRRGYAITRTGHVVREYVKGRGGKTVRRMEHRAAVEDDIGRPLTSNEVVHHINGIKTDNRRANLYLCESRNHHMRVHRSLELLCADLLASKVVRFNNDKGVYELCETGK